MKSTRFRKTQDHLIRRQFPRVCGSQACSILGKFPAKQASDIENRTTPTYQTLIMGTVADHIALRTQNCVLQGHCVYISVRLGSALHRRTLHHRTSRKTCVHCRTLIRTDSPVTTPRLPRGEDRVLVHPSTDRNLAISSKFAFCSLYILALRRVLRNDAPLRLLTQRSKCSRGAASRNCRRHDAVLQIKKLSQEWC